ncbi:MAG: AAA family ATPase [Ruminococcus sp.]|nr:AAA family ATPase [Ruminococcus sp.]
MEFIFVTGPSAVGKSTLSRGLCGKLGGVLIEQNMVPEFTVPPYVSDEGAYEEKVCWGNVLCQIEYFHNTGFRNIIVNDFDDLRVRELPVLFKGHRFIVIRLCSSDPEQIKVQMIHRAKNEGGLYAPEGVGRLNALISSRPLMPNEVKLDIAGKTAEQVLGEAMDLLEGFEPELDYDYMPGDQRYYHSWVHSRGLNWEWTAK